MNARVKFFNRSIRVGKLEAEVNEFLQTHKVGQLSMACTSTEVVVMIAYEEE